MVSGHIKQVVVLYSNDCMGNFIECTQYWSSEASGCLTEGFV